MDILDLVLLAFIPIDTVLLISGYYIVYVKRIKQQPIKVKPNKAWILVALISAIPFALYKIFTSLASTSFDSIGVVVQALFFLSVVLTGFAIYQTYKYFNKRKNRGVKNSDTVKKIVEIALGLTLAGYVGFFAVRYDIIGDARGDKYVSEMTPVFNKDGTLKHDRHGDVVYDTYYSYETIPGTLAGDNAMYLLFTLCANAGSIVTLCVLKASAKKE